MDEHLLPLFPLELVLFPDEVLPLHIFEERYKQMIGECLSGGGPRPGSGQFGVVRMRGGHAERVGCTAEITRVIRRYEDGRLDILTAGRRRFEVLFTNAEKPYLRAAVSFFDDDEEDSPSGAELARAERLFAEVAARLEISSGTARERQDARQPSFHLAAALPLGFDFKQELLALRSERERLRKLSALMEALVPALAERAQARASASGNGRVKRPPPGEPPPG